MPDTHYGYTLSVRQTGSDGWTLRWEKGCEYVGLSKHGLTVCVGIGKPLTGDDASKLVELLDMIHDVRGAAALFWGSGGELKEIARQAWKDMGCVQ